MPDLPSLLARIESATGPDREIDAYLADWLDQQYIGADAPCYTASIDAGIALCERVLPGWSWAVDSGYAANHQKSHAEAWTGDDEGSGDAATPALALCAAIIKARMET